VVILSIQSCMISYNFNFLFRKTRRKKR